MSEPVVSLEARRLLARRVTPGAYYTDGCALFEVTAVEISSACVCFRSSLSGDTRCLGIKDFRAKFWLVRSPSQAASVAA